MHFNWLQFRFQQRKKPSFLFFPFVARFVSEISVHQAAGSSGSGQCVSTVTAGKCDCFTPTRALVARAHLNKFDGPLGTNWLRASETEKVSFSMQWTLLPPPVVATNGPNDRIECSKWTNCTSFATSTPIFRASSLRSFTDTRNEFRSEIQWQIRAS